MISFKHNFPLFDYHKFEEYRPFLVQNNNIDRSFLSERAGTLSPGILKEIDAGIRLALSI